MLPWKTLKEENMKKLSLFFLILLLTTIFHFKNSYGIRQLYDEEYKANLEKNIDETLRKLELNPNDADAHYNLGRAYYKLVAHFDAEDNIQKAISEFRKALELKPDYQIVYSDLGMAYMLEDKEDEAIAAWNKGLTIKIDPQHSYADSFNYCLKKISQFRVHIEQCKKTIVTNPRDAEAYFLLGDTYYKIWEQYRGKNKLNNAIEALTRAVAINPNLAEAHARLGYAYLSKGKEEKEAAIEFRKAVEIKPDFPPFASLYMLLGDIDESEGKLDEAGNKYEHAFKLRRYMGMWQEYFETPGFFRLVQKEEEQWKKAIEENPSDYEAHYRLGMAYLSRGGNLRDATVEFEKALKIKPDYVDAYCILGDICDSQQLSLAVENYNKALKLRPEDAKIYCSLGGIYLCMLSNNKNDKTKYINEARAAFEKAIEINPHYFEAHYGLGSIHEEIGKLDQAIEELKKTIEIEPYYGVAHHKLGIIYDQMGHFELAKQHIKEAKKLGIDYFTTSIEQKYCNEE